MISRPALLPVAIALFAASSVSPRQASSPSPVHKLFLDDQKDRSGPGLSIQSNDLFQRDANRRTQVHAMLEASSLKTAEDFHDAAYIYQHGQTPDDYLLAHILATVAVAKGDATSLWISAATLDRYLDSVHQPQAFGTQYHSNGKPPFTQEPYSRDLIPDQLRAVYCVPSLDQQKENLSEFDAGKYPAGIVPKGCTR